MDHKIARIIKPENKLKNKIGDDISIHDLLKPEVVQGAQQVIEEKTADFLEWAKEDMAKLEQAFDALQARGEPDTELIQTMDKAAQRLRDRSGTFNYVLASQVAKSLVGFCEQPMQNHEYFMIVVQKHVESLQSIFAYHLTGDGGTQGKELIVSLRKLIKMYAE